MALVLMLAKQTGEATDSPLRLLNSLHILNSLHLDVSHAVHFKISKKKGHMLSVN